MNDNRSLFVGLAMAALASLATAEAISPPEQRGVSKLEEGIQVHPSNTAWVCPSDTLPQKDSEATLQAVMDATFEGTYSGEACWLDRVLLHQAAARQQTGQFTPIR
jgi:hypothetical protein